MARHATARALHRPSRTALVVGLVLVAVLAGAGVFFSLEGTASSPHARGRSAAGRLASGRSSSTTTVPRTATTTTTSTLPPPGPGFVADHVTAVGDSVMLDYQDPLKTDVPGIGVDASVSRQWAAGESTLQSMKASGQLGAEVVVGLGTNGPITDADFDSMMAILGGASRVVFVNVHVDRPWQDPNNAVLAQGANRYRNAFVADWATLAAQNPQWFGADGTHLVIDGPGAAALASLVSFTLTNG
jgi:hypothetical protein